MKVLLQQNVSKLGTIGDIVDVKSGYARNYLIPERLATEPTEANVKAIEAAKQQYLAEMAKMRQEIEARAAVLRGREVTIAARANEEGLLYGSVGPAQIIEALGEHGPLLEPSNIVLPDPIRRLDKYDVQIDLGHDVIATIHVWVVPIHEEGEAEAQPDAPPGPADAPAAERDEAEDEPDR